MALNVYYCATIVAAVCTLLPRTGADFSSLGLHGSVDSSQQLGLSIDTTRYESIRDAESIRQSRSIPYGGYFEDSARHIPIPRHHHGRRFPTGGSRDFGALRSLVYPPYESPMMYPRSGIISSTSSSHGGSSSGTAGSAAAIGTSAAGIAQSSSLQDGTAGATSGLAATHNVYGANRATGSSAKGGTSSSSGGYGAASGLGYSNYHKGKHGIGNIGTQNGYSGSSSGGKAGSYIGSNHPETYGTDYAIENSGITGVDHYLDDTVNYDYVDTHSLGSKLVNKGHGGRNAFGHPVGSSVDSNLFGGHAHGVANALEGSMGNYRHVSAGIMGSQASTYENNAKLSPIYIGGLTSDGANTNRNYADMYREGGIESIYEGDAVYGTKGVYAGSDAFGYSKEAGQGNNGGQIGYQGIGFLNDIREREVIFGGSHHGKQGYAGTVNYLDNGFEAEPLANIYVPAIMGGGNSIEGLGTHNDRNSHDNTYTTHTKKGFGISEAAGKHRGLIGSSSSSGQGGSSSATSGYGAALGTSAEGRAHSSSLHEGASEATSGLAAAMGTHGKNKALGSSSEKGTSTGTGGTAAANALGVIKARMGTFGSSSSSGYGGSSTGTSGLGAAMGLSSFGRAQSSSLRDGTSGATSGFGATQSFYGRNRAAGSSNTGGTSSSTGGYGAASGLGYNVRGQRIKDLGAMHYRNPYTERQSLMGFYPGDGYAASHGGYYGY